MNEDNSLSSSEINESIANEKSDNLFSENHQQLVPGDCEMSKKLKALERLAERTANGIKQLDAILCVDNCRKVQLKTQGHSNTNSIG